VECLPQLRLVELGDHEGLWAYFGLSASFGFDKLGRPLYLQRAGLANRRFREMHAHFGKDAIIMRWVLTQEIQAARMEEASERLGRPVTQQVVIMDVQGLSMWPDPLAVEVFLEFLTLGSRYYPETLGMQIFLNVNPIFKGLWRVLRRALDPVTREKVQLLGADYRSTLLDYVDADQLPREFGGTNDFEILSSSHGPEDFVRLLDDLTRHLARAALPGTRRCLCVPEAHRPTQPKSKRPAAPGHGYLHWALWVIVAALALRAVLLLLWPAQ